MFEISTLKFVKLQNFVKKKLLKVLTKNALFGYFLDWIKKKLLSYFKSAHSNFSNFKILRQKKKKQKKNEYVLNQNTLFGYFWAWILKNYSHIWSRHAQTCLIAKFYEEIKMPNFGIKNPWFTIFDQKCLIGIFLE